MREIKFRAWYKEELKYIYNYQSNCIFEAYGFWSPEIFYYEQFTGLKDKNGKEIYEGDIIKTNVSIEVMKFHESLGYDQKYMASGFYFEDQLEYYDKGEKGWEVIGNIHENPELLNA